MITSIILPLQLCTINTAAHCHLEQGFTVSLGWVVREEKEEEEEEKEEEDELRGREKIPDIRVAEDVNILNIPQIFAPNA